ncbi:MAG TPA: nuclear transport factor 2 family protein [Chitinophagaceae bacterium]|jgi:ketosteroid isomerase-like protein
MCIRTEEVKQAYAHWKNAMIKSDLHVLEKIYTDNFLWTNNMGITNNKTENLNKISSGNLRYLSWINESMTVDMLGDIAIIKTREILKMIVYNQRVSAVQDVTVIFINQDGNWLLAGGQEISCSLN